jgi:hypothetical protein
MSVLGSLLLTLFAVEGILTFIAQQDLSQRVELFKKLDIDKNINHSNAKYAIRNPFAIWEYSSHVGNVDTFTDTVHTLKKKVGSYRVAILGDSFIWGDSVPYDMVWSHRLERILQDKYGLERIEMMHWGRSGWSTWEEFYFLKKFGWQYDIDLLIVGFVFNDLESMDDVKNKVLKPKYLTWHSNNWLVKQTQILLPKTVELIVSSINLLLERYTEYGYHNAVLKQLYSPERLNQYSNLLKQLLALCDRYNIKLLFVLTPYESFYHQKAYSLIIPLLKQLNIQYINLLPITQEKAFSKYSKVDLWATPTNPHPGIKLTWIYAQEVFSYIVNNRLIE